VLRKVANDNGFPKADTDALIEIQRKNIVALGEASEVAAGGVQSMTRKQHELFEASLREAPILVRRLKRLGNPQGSFRKQTELAKRLYDIGFQSA
jgi:hypothetical protein